ncbi:MAG: hypothetical protein R3A79_30475 [Nannocystaceae bacterium]
MPLYREAVFQTTSLEHAYAIWDQIDALDGVRVARFRHREVGLLQRARLFVPELEVRFLLVLDTDSADARDTGGDPYRVSLVEVARTQFPGLRALLEAVDASERPFDAAYLYFTLMITAQEERFADRVAAAAGTHVKIDKELEAIPPGPGSDFTQVEPQAQRYTLTMRLRGPPEDVHRAADVVRKSGLIHPSLIRLTYV